MALSTSTEGQGPVVTVDRKLWLTADRSALVEDGDEAAAFLWATPGDEVSAEDAALVGYAPVKAVSAPANKAVKKAPNKSRKASSNK